MINTISTLQSQNQLDENVLIAHSRHTINCNYRRKIITFEFAMCIFAHMNVMNDIRRRSNFGNVPIVMWIGLFTAGKKSLETLKWRHFADLVQSLQTMNRSLKCTKFYTKKSAMRTNHLTFTYFRIIFIFLLFFATSLFRSVALLLPIQVFMVYFYRYKYFHLIW